MSLCFDFRVVIRLCLAVIPEQSVIVFIAIIAVTLRQYDSSFADLLRISFVKQWENIASKRHTSDRQDFTAASRLDFHVTSRAQ